MSIEMKKKCREGYVCVCREREREKERERGRERGNSRTRSSLTFRFKENCDPSMFIFALPNNKLMNTFHYMGVERERERERERARASELFKKLLNL